MSSLCEKCKQPEVLHYFWHSLCLACGAKYGEPTVQASEAEPEVIAPVVVDAPSAPPAPPSEAPVAE